MAKNETITAENFRKIMKYDPDTGIFTWLVNAGRGYCRRHVGDAAGYISSSTGYLMIGIGKREYAGHRLAFLWMIGRWPNPKADHRDLDRSNNRWTNLREATQSQNMANSPKRRSNTSGLKGVTFHSQNGNWMAQIKVAYRRIYLGVFDCPAAAHFSYVVAADKHFGEFARGN